MAVLLIDCETDGLSGRILKVFLQREGEVEVIDTSEMDQTAIAALIVEDRVEVPFDLHPNFYDGPLGLPFIPTPSWEHKKKRSKKERRNG